MAENLFSLKGKNAVVIGGAGGLGRVLAAGLAEYGAQVGIADMNEEGLKSAAEEIKAKTGAAPKTYVVNTDQEESIQALVKNTVKDMGRVHVLVNAQGFNAKGTATEFPVDIWDKLFSANVRGVMLCCKNFAAHMVEQGGGKIINLSSIRGQRAAMGGNLGYCATKGAVDMITRTMAVELATKGVFVNALGPIITRTGMTAETIKNNPERYAKTLDNIPMKRFGEPEDLIGPAVFLASAASDFVTGTILYPDGGTLAFV